jgi:hypothetical protein
MVLINFVLSTGEFISNEFLKRSNISKNQSDALSKQSWKSLLQFSSLAKSSASLNQSGKEIILGNKSCT